LTQLKENRFIDPIIDKAGKITRSWYEFFRDLQTVTNLHIQITGTPTPGDIPVFDTDPSQLIDSGKLPPTGAFVGTTDAQTLTNKTLISPVLSGPSLLGLAAGMPLELNASLVPMNVYGHKQTVVTHSADTVLTIADMRKIHVFDCSVNDIKCDLPAGSLSDVGEGFIAAKSGNGSLRVKAQGLNTIMDSGPGGSLFCDDPTYAMAKIGLILMAETAWHSGPGSFGVWMVL
jgi:hypothetical protein